MLSYTCAFIIKSKYEGDFAYINKDIQRAIFLVFELVLLCVCIPIISGKWFPLGLHRKNTKNYPCILFYGEIDFYLWLENGDLCVFDTTVMSFVMENGLTRGGSNEYPKSMF